jgi:hypothetical protein
MLISMRRTVATLAAAGIVLTACGTAEEAVSNSAEDPVATAAVDEPALTPIESDSGDLAAEAPVKNEASSGNQPVTAATEPAPAPVPEAVTGGRTLASQLSPASDFPENALPDIQVDDIRRQMKVSLRNVFPAERPVLFWLWAPH